MKVRLSLILAALVCCLPLAAQDWPQWALDARHTGAFDAVGQHLNRNIVNKIYDPLVPAELQQTAGQHRQRH